MRRLILAAVIGLGTFGIAGAAQAHDHWCGPPVHHPYRAAYFYGPPVVYAPAPVYACLRMRPIHLRRSSIPATAFRSSDEISRYGSGFKPRPKIPARKRLQKSNAGLIPPPPGFKCRAQGKAVICRRAKIWPGPAPNCLPAAFICSSNFARAFSHMAPPMGTEQPPLVLQSLKPGASPQPPWCLQSFMVAQSCFTVAQSPKPAQSFFALAPKPLHSFKPRQA